MYTAELVGENVEMFVGGRLGCTVGVSDASWSVGVKVGRAVGDAVAAVAGILCHDV